MVRDRSIGCDDHDGCERGPCKQPRLVRGQTPYWEYPCGCEASALGIKYCAKHAAAPALLAIAEWVSRLQDADGSIHFPPATLIDAARAAIAQAKGETK